MRDWEAIIPPEERAVYQRAGFGRPTDLGRRAGLLVVDCTLEFTGSRDQPMAAAQAEFHLSCGPTAWAALPAIRRLLDLFRERQLPVVFSNSDLVSSAVARSATKSPPDREKQARGNGFVDLIAPAPGEWVMGKSRASTFYGTPLASYYVQHGVDTVVVVGTTTSGCVRASVVDAFSAGFTVFVVEEGAFDRARVPHLVNLWDMNSKYATVVTLPEMEALLGA